VTNCRNPWGSRRGNHGHWRGIVLSSLFGREDSEANAKAAEQRPALRFDFLTILKLTPFALPYLRRA
jgi:hypothetical protein